MNDDPARQPDDDMEEAPGGAEPAGEEMQAPVADEERKARTRRRLRELDELSPLYRDITAPPGLKLIAMLVLAGVLLSSAALVGQALIQAMERYNQRLDRLSQPPRRTP